MAIEGPKRPYRVWGFSSTHDAIAAEDALLAAGIAAQTIPRPAEIGGAECGISVRVPHEYEDAARAALEAARIDIVGSILVLDR